MTKEWRGELLRRGGRRGTCAGRGRDAGGGGRGLQWVRGGGRGGGGGGGGGGEGGGGGVC